MLKQDAVNEPISSVIQASCFLLIPTCYEQYELETIILKVVNYFQAVVSGKKRHKA